MSDTFEEEISELAQLFKNHREIKDVTVNNEESSAIVDVRTRSGSETNWSFVKAAFETYFNVKHNRNLQLNYVTPYSGNRVDLGDGEELVFVSKPKESQQPIVSFTTEKGDWRLFRFYSQAGKSFTSDYYEPQQEIADKEIANLEDTYQHIVNDMKKKVFTRNIIELNINCLNNNALKDAYVNALRKLPIQLKNRIAISLVRIPKNVSIHTLRQAALICKLCTDNIFLSLPYTSLLDKEKMDQIYGISGYVITVPKGEVGCFEDLKKIYDKLNWTFSKQKAFLIISDSIECQRTYKSSKILTLYEREKIGLAAE